MRSLENIDQLAATLEVPRTLAGIAFVRAPEVSRENFPLLVLYAERVGILTMTWSLTVTADQRVSRVIIGAYPPVIPKDESGVIAKPGGLDAFVPFDDGELSERKIPGERNWCGALSNSAGVTELQQRLRESAVLDARLNDLARLVIERRRGATA